LSYNLTSFSNDPDKANSPGVLYVLVLVNKKTDERECLKIGITQGNSYKAVTTRAKGFQKYEHRVQKIIKGTLLEVYNLEQTLHSLFKEYKYRPEKFGGHTECFKLDILKDVLQFLKDN
jgi:hypothetical protein